MAHLSLMSRRYGADDPISDFIRFKKLRFERFHHKLPNLATKTEYSIDLGFLSRNFSDLNIHFVFYMSENRFTIGFNIFLTR
jgi:hypothetical protein